MKESMMEESQFTGEFQFTGGRTCPESLPIQGLIDATKRVLNLKGKQLVNYPGMADLHAELRQVASSRFEHREGIPLPTENILITTGAMQALTLSVQTLAESGGTVITEEVTYMGALACFRHFKLNIVGVPIDIVDGMDVDALDHTLRSLATKNIKPKFIYVTPNHHNPTGAILSLSRRKRMVELAQENNVLILEDDCYGDVDFEPSPVLQALYTLGDPQSIIFVGSFSKILAPGVRLGYLCAPNRLLNQIKELKKFSQDHGSSALASFIVAEYLRDNLWDHVAKHNAIIKEKRDTLLEALKEHFGDCASWSRPRGGLVVWVKLPETTDTQKLEQLALERGVRYSPGRMFHVSNEDIKYLRLSFAHMSLDTIREGVAVLAKSVRDASQI